MCLNLAQDPANIQQTCGNLAQDPANMLQDPANIQQTCGNLAPDPAQMLDKIPHQRLNLLDSSRITQFHRRNSKE